MFARMLPLLFLFLPALPGSAQRCGLKTICKVATASIDESSGLEPSMLSPGVFWTHNDDAGDNRLFAFDSTGALRSTVTLDRAQPADWEDLSAFRRNGIPMLMAADAGNNLRLRDTLVLLIFPEPSFDIRHTDIVRKILFRFEDGRRDCEAVAVDGLHGIIYLISKTFQLHCTLYTLQLRDTPFDRQTARVVTKLPWREVTSMDISDDGMRAAVLTYDTLYQFARDDSEGWEKTFRRRPRLQCALPKGQWEAVCFGTNNHSLYLTRENAVTKLYMVTDD